jgi:hypothetical protein
MPPRRSTIPLFKAALITALKQATWTGEPPQVCYGNPRNPTREDVIVGDTSQEGDDQQDWAAIGNRQRDETYALNLVIDVTTPGADCQVAVERAFALFAVVEDVLRTTPTMGVAGVVVGDLRQPVHIESQTDEGWVVSIESAARVQARI